MDEDLDLGIDWEWLDEMDAVFGDLNERDRLEDEAELKLKRKARVQKRGALR